MLPCKTLVVLFLTFLFAASGTAWGNPSDQEPTAPLALHGVSNAEELLKRYRALFDKTVQDLQRILAREDRILAPQLHDFHVNLQGLRRGAVDLQMLGETAGVDYALRVESLRQGGQEALTRFQANPTSGRQVAEVRQSLQNLSQRNVPQAFRRVEQLEQQQRWDQAYEVFQSVYDSVRGHAIFLSAREADLQLAPFMERNRGISRRRNEQFRSQAYAALEEQLAHTQPDLAGLLEAVAVAGEQVSRQGTAEFEELSRSGPECLAHFLDRWPEVHLQMLRGRAMVWAHQARVSGTFLTETPDAPPHREEAEYAEFCQQFLEGLAGIVLADAERLESDQAESRYIEYLEVLSPRVSQVAEGRLEQALEPALKALIDRSPALSQQVAAYEAATRELLRWRERMATEAAEARAADFPTSDSLLRDAFTSRDAYQGLLADADSELSEAALRAGAPAVLEPAVERLIDRGIRLDQVVGLPSGRLAVSRYRQRHYATLPRPEVGTAVEQLRRELFVSAKAPPLTLAAHSALVSAEQGDFRAVGGNLHGVFLEGVIPRFATLPAGALPMIPLGPLPVESPATNQMLPQVMLRLQVLPSWAAHRYFFLDLADES